MFDLIKKLSGAFGVSGNEEEIRDIITAEIKDKVDEIRTDAMGNLIAVKKGKGKKIMVAAHMDEIGVMATYIDEKGFIRFSNIGWVSQYFALGQRVRFKNGTIGAVYYDEKVEDFKDLKLNKMFIDIGARDKKEAEARVSIGDVACFIGDAYCQGNMVIGKAMDNRSSCAALIKVIHELPATDNEIYFVFTVQEELGLRGARTAAYQLKPDMGIAIDVTLTGDIPECPPMEVKCGKGPAIKIKDNSAISHPTVKRLLEDTAKEKGIPYQYEVLEAGGSDTGAIQTTAGGAPAGAISIPCRYTHSPVEMICLDDVENAVKLLVQAIIV